MLNPEALPSLELDTTARLQAVAEGHGMQLDSGRLNTLVTMADRAAAAAEEGRKISFKQDGMMIAPPTELEGTDETVSQMHYLPQTKAMPRGATVTQGDESMSVMHRGIRSMQNYALLVEAGFMARPTRLFGRTNNAEMMTIAGRFGFEEVHPGSGDVEATFEAVHARILSPETVQLEEKLTQRAIRHLGGAALQ